LDAPLTAQSCPFERAILSRTCACRFAKRVSMTPNQKVQCASEYGYRDCVDMLNHVRKNVNFSIGLTHVPSALPRAQATRLQCGMLIGLQNALDKVVEHSSINNIYDTVQRAIKRYGPLQNLPVQELIRSIAAYNK